MPSWHELTSELFERLACAAPPSQSRAQLVHYLELVHRFNRGTRVVGPGGGPAFVEVLLSDASVLSDPTLVPWGARLLDVGAGAGAPTIPLLLLRPDLEAILMEPRQRRAALLRWLQGELDPLRGRVRVLPCRIDPRRPEGPAGITLALQRATFPPETWLTLAPRLAPSFLVLSTEPVRRFYQGLRPVAEAHYRLPWSNAPRWAARYARESGEGSGAEPARGRSAP